MDQDIRNMMTELNIPGFSLALFDRENIILSKAYGYIDLEKTEPINNDTLFQIGSLSKAYTSAAFFIAQQKGLIHIDDYLVTHYPEFTIKSRFGEDEHKKITFRHLLSHWSGLQHFTPINSQDSDEFYTFHEYIKEVSNSWFKYKVNTRISYSNPGYDLIAYAIERVSGKSFSEFVRDELYIPLGMKRSQVEPRNAMKLNSIANGYIGTHKYPIRSKMTPLLGSGSQYSSINDMSKFIKMFLNNGKSDGVQILEESSLKEMFTVHNKEENQLSTIGNGFGVLDNLYGGAKVLRFFGDGSGYICHHQFIPELGLGMLIQINQMEDTIFPIFELAGKIMSGIIKIKLGKELPNIDLTDKFRDREIVNLDLSILQRLAGRYISRMFTIDIIEDDGDLSFKWRGQDVVLRSHSSTEFSTDQFPQLLFSLDTTGRPTTISLLEKDGKFTVLDYDTGPVDKFDNDLSHLVKFVKFYGSIYIDVMLYSVPVLENGALILKTSLNNAEFKLNEYKNNIFYTADGSIVELKEKGFLFNDFYWEEVDVSREAIINLTEEDPKNIRLNKSSLVELAYILRQVGKDEDAEFIQEKIDSTK